jgi:RNA polymerase sigma-70 factor (ECF subfamily)
LADQSKFEQLAIEHKDAVYRQMLRVCRSHDDAEDVLAESLMKAYNAMVQLESEESFRPWLVQIGRRVCGRMRKRESARPLVQLSDPDSLLSEAPDLEPSPEDTALEMETKDCLLQAFERLSPEFQTAYRLADMEELPLQDAADQVGVTLAAFKSRLHRAKNALRDEIDNRFSLA